MIDLIAGNPRIMTADAKPKWTLWNPRQVSNVKKSFRKAARRIYKQYMKTGSINDFNRSQRLLTNWDFD
jgi:hypothetical protein